MTEKEIKKRLQKTLSAYRFEHTLSVARLAESLARRHRSDPAQARLAGLLHDCAKELPGRELAAVVSKRRLPVPGKEFIFRSRRWGLLHAAVSAHVARSSFGVRNRGVLSAIGAHTLGKDNMSVLDKIIYVADFAAPHRKSRESAAVRRMARKNLEGAFLETVRMKIQHVLKRSGPLHPQTVKLWNDSL